MPVDLLMPKLGLTMSEGVLLEWKAAPGERVAKGQIIFVVETDKAATEIEAQADGVLEEQIVAEGETAAVGAIVGRLSSEGAAPTGKAKSGLTPDAPSPEVAAAPASPSARQPSTRRKGRIVATPLARRVARERGIDLSGLTGSGPHGRIKRIDVENAPKPAGSSPVLRDAAKATRVKPSPTQASMARRLAAVKQGVPHFYLSSEVEVSALLALREQVNADAERPRLTLNHFILAAVGRALCDLPKANRVWAEGEILTFAQSDVSMAVETDKGLFVPVVREAGTMSLDEVAAQARALVAKTRAGNLAAADMEGGAVAVSNAGMHDVTWLTPIINPGQSAIIGVGSVREVFRPDSAGAPELRREMGLVFSGDHRVHTGVEGLEFLNRVKAYLENPLRLLRHGQTIREA